MTFTNLHKGDTIAEETQRDRTIGNRTNINIF